MAANVYECLFLLASNHFSRDPHGTSNKINDIIAGAGGYYVTFNGYDEKLKQGLPWDGKEHDLTIKIDPRLQDALVAHALGQTVGEQEPAEAATAG